MSITIVIWITQSLWEIATGWQIIKAKWEQWKGEKLKEKWRNKHEIRQSRENVKICIIKFPSSLISCSLTLFLYILMMSCTSFECAWGSQLLCEINSWMNWKFLEIFVGFLPFFIRNNNKNVSKLSVYGVPSATHKISSWTTYVKQMITTFSFQFFTHITKCQTIEFSFDENVTTSNVNISEPKNFSNFPNFLLMTVFRFFFFFFQFSWQSTQD